MIYSKLAAKMNEWVVELSMRDPDDTFSEGRWRQLHADISTFAECITDPRDRKRFIELAAGVKL